MTESAPTASEPASTEPGGDIVARGDSWFRLKWVGMGLIFLVAGGGWFLYDGFVGWPRANEELIAKAKSENRPIPEKSLHSDTDIALQKVIGFGVIPVALLIAFRGLYGTRGEYRLSGNTLHVPGHPPVPLDAVRAIDQTKWDRKGIAYIDYELNGKTGRLKLDDFMYQREPTDQIHDRIVAAVSPGESVSTSGDASDPEADAHS
jgi:hypothetical protein